ncbi:MAG: hypothetical protein Q8P62_04335 [Candidatus Peregrinibacteria bacterium]|nr:hypothetical protein [Candidatus Peregrinibacteria bacterium]
MQQPSNPQENTEAITAASERIMQIRQDVYMMGGNDAKIPQIDFILRKLQAGEITPEDARLQAGKIQDSKMDYH